MPKTPEKEISETLETVETQLPETNFPEAAESTFEVAEEEITLEMSPKEAEAVTAPLPAIEEAAAEWTPDPAPIPDPIEDPIEDTAPEAIEEESAQEATGTQVLVVPPPLAPPALPSEEVSTLIIDPFGINTLEISEAQGEEFVPEELDDSQLDRIAAAVGEADQISEQESQLITPAHQDAVPQEEPAELEAVAPAPTEETESEQAESPNETASEAVFTAPETDEELQSCVEALLFMADKPVSAEKLHKILTSKAKEASAEKTESSETTIEESEGEGVSPEGEAPSHTFHQVLEAITAIRARYAGMHHGIELAEVAGGFQFRTKLIRAPLIKKLAKVQTQRLSSGSMETLAIVAYRQPVLKEDIDQVRGVDSSHFVRILLDRKLIRIAGRSELPGRPMLYATSPEFLEIFGLKSLSDLPSLRELEQMTPGSEAKTDEDPRVLQMRKMVSQMKTDESVNLTYDPREDEKFLKEIRERVNAIPTTTQTLVEQAEREKAEELMRLNGGVPVSVDGLPPVATNENAGQMNLGAET